MNIPTNQKTHYKDGGNYYTSEDRDKIKEIQKKTNESSIRRKGI
jgi:hypothetical protein